MFNHNRLLFMVQVILNMNNDRMSRCPICGGRAIFTNYEGKQRCTRCVPYKEKNE